MPQPGSPAKSLPMRKGQASVQAAAPESAPPAPSPGSTHIDNAVATELLRNAYTRERHYFLMRIIIGQSVSLVLALLLIAFLATRPPQMKYFATDKEGRITQLTPVDQPIGSVSDLATWVTNAIAQAYTMDFANYRAEMSRAEVNFTPAGWEGFQKALKDSGLLKSVIDNKYVTTAAPSGAPVLVAQGHVEGRYAWKFQVPFIVTFESSQRTASQQLNIEVVVVRQPETEQPRGLGIAQLVAQ